jgi:putative SOS response-associated peptidase YedK
MCGRYLLRLNPDLFAEEFGLEFSQLPRDLAGGLFGPRYNVAPTQPVPNVRHRATTGRTLTIVRRTDGTAERELATARWGLIPAWARDPAIGSRMINARAETAAEKPAFRAAFRSRRCVVPASGFYEWERQGRGPKQPCLIQRRDGRPMGFAGLWEEWRDGETGEVVTTCAIVTCPPNELMAELHDRTPVVLDPKDYEAWLDPSDRRGAGLLRPCPAEWLEAVPVSTRVNDPRNDDESVIQPEGGALRAQVVS